MQIPLKCFSKFCFFVIFLRGILKNEATYDRIFMWCAFLAATPGEVACFFSKARAASSYFCGFRHKNLGGESMSAHTKKDDLRTTKTIKALNEAMFLLLEKRNFRKITVSDICGEALVSRATFYSYFNDKYSLLKYWLSSQTSDIFDSVNDTFEKLDITVNHFMHRNKTAITNIIDGADAETFNILYNFLYDILDLRIEKNINGKINPKYVVLSNFCAGGLVFYLSWQVKNRFPAEVPMMNTYSREILDKFAEWAGR